LPVVCIETRHAKAFLKAQINKSDRHDARGIAQMMRVNLFRPVHVKTLTSQKRRVLLTGNRGRFPGEGCQAGLATKWASGGTCEPVVFRPRRSPR
jgi:hypothetical protein